MKLIFSKKGFEQEVQKTIEPLFKKRFNEFKRDIRAYMDPMTGEESQPKYSSNKYTDYAAAVEEVANKYDNKSAWGCALLANIVDFRAAVCVSSGPQYKAKTAGMVKQKDEDGESVGAGAGQEQADGWREVEFAKGFFEANGLDHEMPQDLGREAEIEARIALKLSWDDSKKQVIVEHIPWMKYRYEESRISTDSKKVDKISWHSFTWQGQTIPAGSIQGDELIYRRFGGRTSAKDPMSKIIRCLTEIDYVAQGFRDWREIDRLYASPIPVFECGSKEEAEDMAAAIQGGLNWKIKKAFAVYGKFVMVGPDMAGVASLEKEIIRNACFISGETGYPLQFLLPDLLSNRSTSENIMESALAQTASERAIWTGIYDELLSKAMMIYNAKSGMTQLDPTKISITISQITQAQWDRLTAFWLPAFDKKLVSREAVLPQIPNFNVDEELKRADEADAKETERIAQQLEKMKLDEEARAQQGNQPPAPGAAPGNKSNLNQGGSGDDFNRKL